VRTLRGGPLTATYGKDLEQFLAAKRVKKIVVIEGSSGPWLPLFSSLGVEPQRVADVLVYEVPSRILTARLDAGPRPILKELRGKCG
jgi:hypothetical protein